MVLSFATCISTFPTTVLRSENEFLQSSVLEHLGEPPSGWTKDAKHSLDKEVSTVTLQIHLVQQGITNFYKVATKVYIILYITVMV